MFWNSLQLHGYCFGSFIHACTCMYVSVIAFSHAYTPCCIQIGIATELCIPMCLGWLPMAGASCFF
jgi:hypothetical protein